MYQGFATYAQGHSHKEKDIPCPCQDAADFKLGDDYAIAAVSDGHGGEKYFRSDKGSVLAIKIAIRCLEAFLKNHRERLVNTTEKQQSEILKDVERHIISEWREAIEKDFADRSLEPHEKYICARYPRNDIPINSFQAYFYGATLLYACMTPNYSFAAQIGDGASVFLKADAIVDMPVPGDERLGFGVTTSLCDSDAANNFRHYFAPASEGVEAIFLCTDGMVDSFTRDSFPQVNQKILNEMRKNKVLAETQLQEWLPALSEKGSRDDVAMAGIYQLDESGEKIIPQKPKTALQFWQ